MSENIYGLPLIVARKVQEEIDKSNHLVIEELFNRLAIKMQQIEFRIQYGVNEDWHAHHKISNQYDRGCGCIYCQAMHRYISTKISAHRLRRRIDDLNFMYNPYDTPQGLQHLQELEKEWPKLRAVSHQIRDMCGLN
jgi:hypothetical protein